MTAFAQWHDASDFEIPNTFMTPIGDTLEERITAYANPHADSAALMADFANGYNFGFLTSTTYIAPASCIATDADPLKTVAFEHYDYGVTPTNDEIYYQVTSGWNQLHIPDDCTPPWGNDGLATIVNTDQPDYVWTFYRLRRTTPGGVVTWKMNSVHKWCRTVACAESDEILEDGRGAGINPIYIPFSGANGACPNTAVYSFSTIHLEDLVAGYIPHALVLAAAERGLGHFKQYPCQADFVQTSTQGACYTGSPHYHCTTEHPGEHRPNAFTTGERIMLNPEIDVDAIAGISADTKTILKALQIYGQIPIDGAGPHDFSIILGAEALGRDFTAWGPGTPFATTNAFLVWMFQNSRRVMCVDGWEGECAGAAPPAGAGGTVTVTSTSPPDGEDNTVYAGFTLTAIGGTEPYSWAVVSGSLPTGLTLTDDEIDGTPTVPGDFSFTVEVTTDDMPALTDTQALNIHINEEDVPVIPPDDSLPNPNAVGFVFNNSTITITDAQLPPGSRYRHDGTVTIPITYDTDLIDVDDPIYFFWRTDGGRWHYAGSVTDADSFDADLTALGIPAGVVEFFATRKIAGIVWGDISVPIVVIGGNIKISP